MTHHRKTMIGGLMIVLQTLCQRYGVRMTMGGNTAYTDGEVINIPDLPPDDESALLLARGYGDHESAHVAFTNFAVKITPWVNLIEDVRIEELQGSKYLGCAVNLKNLATYLKEKEGAFQGEPEQPISCLMSWMCCRSRSVVLRHDLNDIADEAEANCRNLFGDPFCDAFTTLIGYVGWCHSTEDSEELANKVLDLIKNPPEPLPQPQPPQPGSQEDQEPDDQGQDSPGEPSPSDQDKGEQPGAPSGQDNQQEDDANPSGSPDDSDPQSSSSESAAGSNPSASEQDPENSGDQPSGAAQSSAKNSPESQKENLYKLKAEIQDEEAVKTASENMDVGGLLQKLLDALSTSAYEEGTIESVPTTITIRRNGDLAYYLKKEFDGARRKTSRLRASLAGLFQSSKAAHRGEQVSGHRIARNSIHRIACKTTDTRIFSARRDIDKENTAIVIMVDKSGSMGMDGGNKMVIANQSALVTAEAIESLPGVTCAVGFFPGGEYSQVLLGKSFDTKVDPRQFDVSANGGTPVHEALYWAGMHLCQRKEERKIVIIMTDGESADDDLSRRAVSRLREAGIEIFGLGICDKDIQNWLNNDPKIIKTIDELPKALIETLKRALIKERRAA